jgi:hypothetical protein
MLILESERRIRSKQSLLIRAVVLPLSHVPGVRTAGNISIPTSTIRSQKPRRKSSARISTAARTAVSYKKTSASTHKAMWKDRRLRGFLFGIMSILDRILMTELSSFSGDTPEKHTCSALKRRTGLWGFILRVMGLECLRSLMRYIATMT